MQTPFFPSVTMPPMSCLQCQHGIISPTHLTPPSMTSQENTNHKKIYAHYSALASNSFPPQPLPTHGHVSNNMTVPLCPSLLPLHWQKNLPKVLKNMTPSSMSNQTGPPPPLDSPTGCPKGMSVSFSH